MKLMKANLLVALVIVVAACIGIVASQKAHAQPIPRPTQTVHGAVYDALFHECTQAEMDANYAVYIKQRGGSLIDYSSTIEGIDPTDKNMVTDNGYYSNFNQLRGATNGKIIPKVNEENSNIATWVGRVIFLENFDGDVFALCMAHPERFNLHH